MIHIMPNITSLMQYLSLFKNTQESYRLEKCPDCGRLHPQKYGFYYRQSDRINSSAESLNAIFIQRYYCPGCKKTCSVLPECIPPHRWYLWVTQEAVLLSIFMGSSVYAATKKALPSRQTIGRWVSRIQEQFVFHKDALCNLFSNLGRASTCLNDFWSATLKTMNLGAAMRLCHATGVFIP